MMTLLSGLSRALTGYQCLRWLCECRAHLLLSFDCSAVTNGNAVLSCRPSGHPR